MNNFINLGETSELYPEIIYTPTQISQPEPRGAENEKPTLDWAKDVLKGHTSSTVTVKDNDTEADTETSTEDTKPRYNYWDAWKDDDSKITDMQYTSPTGKTYASRDAFKTDLYNAYLKALKEKNINPEFAKYLVAQDALESRYGASSLSAYNNFGGIKATKDSDYAEFKTKEWDKKENKYKEITSKFRVFKSLDDYCKYKIALLGNNNYKTFTRKPEEFADSLTTYARMKYATDPNYKMKINSMVKSMWS